MLNKKDRDISLDYQTPLNIRINTRPGKELNVRDMKRCISTLHNFKNAVMYYLHGNRKEKKLPKLKDVLEKVIAKQARMKLANREKSNNPLDMLMGGDHQTLDGENYIMIKDNLTRISLDITENNQTAFLLEGKLNWTLRKPEKIKIKKKRKKTSKNPFK